jgi:hypothetical protein
MLRPLVAGRKRAAGKNGECAVTSLLVEAESDHFVACDRF